MAISKRLRFEILRRDNHSCRYCGRSAPEVVLHVDHVTPRALGGGDEPENLVTSCDECNGGKGSSAPDQHLVAEVSESAVRWSSAMAQAAAEMESRVSERDAIYNAVVEAWPSYRRNQIPFDFSESIDQFINAGLPEKLIVELARLAGSKPEIYKRWSYFCGCCWTKIRQMQERAAEILDTDG